VSTLANLRNADTGFDPSGVTTARFHFRMAGRTGEAVGEFLRRVVPAARAQPGVTDVAVANGTPLMGAGIYNRMHLPGEDPGAAEFVGISDVSAGYFETLGIELVAGRGFLPEEEYGTGLPPGIVVSQALARRLFGETPAHGRLLSFPATMRRPAHDVPIVGVAEDVRADGPTEAVPEIAYLPIERPSGLNDTLLVRSTLPPADVAHLIRDAAAAIDPGLPMTVQSMDEIASLRLGQERLFAWVLSVLAGLGFLLAAVGIHGLVSQTVVERTREFGVRLAIGATRGHVVGLVFRSALVVMLIGAPAGLVVAYLASRLVESRLYGVTPADPGVYATAIAALLAVVFLASLIPARTASRANPVDVLRAE
jgi:predicted permease